MVVKAKAVKAARKNARPGVVGRVAAAAKAHPVRAAALVGGAALVGAVAAKALPRIFRGVRRAVGSRARKDTTARLGSQLRKLKLKAAIVRAKRALFRAQMQGVV